MPAPTYFDPSNISIRRFQRPSSLPRELLLALQSDILSECNSNIILPHLLKCLEKERHGEVIPPDQFWITCHTNDRLDFVLSCTEGPLGTYPIFIFAASHFDQLRDSAYTRPRIIKLIHELLTAVSVERVFSVFAPEPVAEIYGEAWTEITHVALAREPEYYAATFTYCTMRSFVDKSMTVCDGFIFGPRLAVEADKTALAELCQAFSATGPPFVLDYERSLEEAEILIRNRQIWVHDIRQGDGQAEIASIVAFTRVSPKVAAITKVFTNPKWRKRGCAVRLVRRVTKHLLKTKEAVVLYVSHGNPAARVYDQVGFVGLRNNAHEFPGVDNWLELGFDRDVVQRGHW